VFKNVLHPLDVIAFSEIPTLGRLRQEDCNFEDALGYKVRPCLKTPPPHQKMYFLVQHFYFSRKEIVEIPLLLKIIKQLIQTYF
jgi:hypothetical protein